MIRRSMLLGLFITTGCSLMDGSRYAEIDPQRPTCGESCSPAPTPPATEAQAASLSVTQPTVTLIRAGSATLHVDRVASNDGPVTLHVDGLPAGVTAADVVVGSPGPADIALGADPEAIEGLAAITIVATSAHARATASVPLLVRGPSGALDRTFADRGVSTISFGNDGVGIRSLAIQSDGKILSAGSGANNFQLTRHTTSGQLDTSFDQDGKVTTAFGTQGTAYANSVFLQEGSIVVAGFVDASKLGLTRYTMDGALDATFGAGGIVTTSVGGQVDCGSAAAPDRSGRIVVSGYTFSATTNFDSMVLRYDGAGALDTTFNGTGRDVTAISTSNDFTSALALQADGKIVTVGQAQDQNVVATVLRYTALGQLDKDFAGGVVRLPAGFDTRAWAVTLTPEGKIVVVGNVRGSDPNSQGDSFVARVMPDGTLDTSFAGTGLLRFALSPTRDEFTPAVTVQRDGRILIAGWVHNGSNPDFAVARFMPDGTFDASFGESGVVINDLSGIEDGASAIALQDDGRILVGGWANQRAGTGKDFVLARYWP